MGYIVPAKRLRLAEEYYTKAVTAVIPALKDGDRRIREAALEILPQIAAKGDAQAFTAISACIQDKEWYVRKAAALALPLIVDRGNRQAITAINALLEDPEWYVRKAAVEARSQIDFNDEHA